MITPAQCRAARALLNLSQKQLAASTGISLRSLQGFEHGDRKLHSLTLNAIVGILDRQGIVLIDQRDWIGVKLRIQISADG